MEDDYYNKIAKAVENHRAGKHGSEEELVQLCYDMVGRILLK